MHDTEEYTGEYCDSHYQMLHYVKNCQYGSIIRVQNHTASVLLVFIWLVWHCNKTLSGHNFALVYNNFEFGVSLLRYSHKGGILLSYCQLFVCLWIVLYVILCWQRYSTLFSPVLLSMRNWRDVEMMTRSLHLLHRKVTLVIQRHCWKLLPRCQCMSKR